MDKSQRIFRNKWFYFFQLIIDIAIIDISYYFGFMLQRAGLFEAGTPTEVIITLLYISVISLLLIIAFKLNQCGRKSYSLTIFYLCLILPVIAFMADIVDFLIKGIGVWRKTIFYAMIIQVPAFIIEKFIFYKLHAHFIKVKKCLIVGSDIKEAAMLLLKMHDNRNLVYKVRYLTGENNPNLYDCINRTEQVIICPLCEKKTEIMEYCAINNIDCAMVPDFREILINSGKFNNINDIMICDMKVKMDIESRVLKRTFDIISSALLIVILSPVMAITALLVKLSDGGKVLYSQKRLTRHNKEFMLYKFRTMIEDAEKETGAVLAELNDQRITKIGSFLRASRIDEILQLFNVLKGDMSLVGPRPERPQLVAETLKEIPEFGYRTLVKAGVTGLAQTLGRYDTEFKDKLRFDLYYVNNYSFLLDLKIVFYTMHTLVTPSVTAGLNKNNDDTDILDILETRGITAKMEKDCLVIG